MYVWLHSASPPQHIATVSEGDVPTAAALRTYLQATNERRGTSLVWAGVFEDDHAVLSLHMFDTGERASAFCVRNARSDRPIISAVTNYRADAAYSFAKRMVSLGCTVYLAKSGEHGFVTDATESRVLLFSMNDGTSLGGSYGPPSKESGTGWRLDALPASLKTAEDVRQALYANPPPYCGKGWRYMTTVAQHLAMLGQSSGHTKFDAEEPSGHGHV